MGECEYCGSDLAAYDPVIVTRDYGPEREEVGRFCGFACLHTHIEEATLYAGEACQC